MSDASTIVAGAYDALAKGDIKGFIGALDPNIKVTEPACLPYGGTFNGLDEVMGMFGKAGPLLDSSKMTVDSVYGEGDRVTAVLQMPLRDGSGVANMVELWTMRDGKAVELAVYWQDPTVLK
jgi:ketosteroid isomerase-like protein